MRAAGLLPRGLLAAAIFTGGCSDRGASVLQDPAPDPEPTVSFSDDVQPICDARCIVCHDSDGPSGLTLLSGVSYGELVGARQSGIPELRFADFGRDGDLLDVAHRLARDAIASDPTLGARALRPDMMEIGRRFERGLELFRAIPG